MTFRQQWSRAASSDCTAGAASRRRPVVVPQHTARPRAAPHGTPASAIRGGDGPLAGVAPTTPLRGFGHELLQHQTVP